MIPESVNLPWFVFLSLFAIFCYFPLIHEFIRRVEKYRPSSLQDLISHEDIIRTSKTFVLQPPFWGNRSVFILFIVAVTKFIDENQLPHLLLYGPPGTGKTSAILACARRLYSPAQFRSMVNCIISIRIKPMKNVTLIFAYSGFRIKRFGWSRN